MGWQHSLPTKGLVLGEPGICLPFAPVFVSSACYGVHAITRHLYPRVSHDWGGAAPGPRPAPLTPTARGYTTEGTRQSLQQAKACCSDTAELHF